MSSLPVPVRFSPPLVIALVMPVACFGPTSPLMPQFRRGHDMTISGAHEPDRYRRFPVAFNPGDTIEQDDGLRYYAFGRLGVNPCPCFNRRPQGVTPAYLQQTGEP
jgi:hypothetical protein